MYIQDKHPHLSWHMLRSNLCYGAFVHDLDLPQCCRCISHVEIRNYPVQWREELGFISVTSIRNYPVLWCATIFVTPRSLRNRIHFPYWYSPLAINHMSISCLIIKIYQMLWPATIFVMLRSLRIRSPAWNSQFVVDAGSTFHVGNRIYLVRCR